jgi:hypothetical protein
MLLHSVKRMKEVHVGVRLPQDLVRAVDTFAKDQAVKTGARYTRTDAVRVLLIKALGHVGGAKK